MKIRKFVRETLTRISPTLNVRMTYRNVMGKRLDLKNPMTLNEKSCWLKLNNYNHNPEVRRLANKYTVRDFVEERGFKDGLTKLYAVYDKPADINWDELPNRFVMKLNVGSRANLICKDKGSLDLDSAKHTVESWFTKKNLDGYWLAYGELQYKDVEPKILIEQFLEDPSQESLIDYKFFSINSSVEFVMVCMNRFSDSGVDFYVYDKEGKFWPCFEGQEDPQLRLPDNFSKAVQVAKKLSTGFPYVRVDLYIVNNKVYFGEMTFTGSGGFDKDIHPVLDEKMGKLLNLSKVEILK